MLDLCPWLGSFEVSPQLHTCLLWLLQVVNHVISRSIAISIFVLTLSACDETVLFQNFVPLASSLNLFDCDAPAGHFTRSGQWPLFKPIDYLEGEFQLTELQEHPKWSPLVRAQISTRDEETFIQANLVAAAGSTMATAFVQTRFSGGGIEQRHVGEFPIEDVVAFSISLLPSANAVVSFGSQRKSVSFPKPNAQFMHLYVGCSTAVAEIGVNRIRLRTDMDADDLVSTPVFHRQQGIEYADPMASTL
jgi:hypothetical protein